MKRLATTQLLKQTLVQAAFSRPLLSQALCRSLFIAANGSTTTTRRSAFRTQGTVRSFASKRVIDFNLADIGEGITECNVLEWHVKPGDRVQQFGKICEVASDKATVEITSRYDGVVKELKFKKGEMAIVGKPLISIEVDADEDTPAESQPAAAEKQSSSSAPAAQTPAQGEEFDENSKVMCSPAVRRIAREFNVDLSKVTGTGPKGRVLKEDVQRFIDAKNAPAAAPAPAAATPAAATPAAGVPAGAPTPLRITAVEDKKVPVTGIQQVMVRTMTAAKNVPTLLYCDEYTMDELARVRAELKSFSEAQGVKLSYLPFIIKAVSAGLRQYPMLNAHVNADCTEVIHRGAHNIGLAMDTPRGLLVPNIKHVQDRSILDIARELNRLAALGAAGKLGRDDLTGGTFTLSNIGSIGGTYTSPILVVPEVVIGALGKMQKVPRFDALNNVRPSQVMVASWTADHRVVDGATVARFSNAVKGYLERPTQLLLELK